MSCFIRNYFKVFRNRKTEDNYFRLIDLGIIDSNKNVLRLLI